MEKERIPVEWDDKTDLSSNTIAASNKVRHFIDKAIDGLMERCFDEGMDTRDKLLVWQLIGIPLRYRADAMEAALTPDEIEQIETEIEIEQVKKEEVEKFVNRDSKPG
ncbi:hypothetical protein LCGC14_1252540 [marine sediment metagenome]|uniref:Uncharacterized protein n=1 Tax=marine sediment metagenome TaxID=412755 RepID=A0A0F9P6J8_9ZZZZ